MSLIKTSLRENKPVGFIDPNPMSSTQLLGSEESRKDVKAYLTRALSHFHNARKDYIMFPYSIISEAKTSHWVLLVIILKDNMVWYLDSASHIKRDYTCLIGVIDETCDSFFSMHNMKKSKLTHITDFECHQQPPGDACGFYVCHHMALIMEESTKKKPQEIKIPKRTLTDHELNQVTQEVAFCLMLDTIPAQSEFYYPVN
ncbi:hypothetical protein ACP4OV_012288 [Aristida adscensionis]